MKMLKLNKQKHNKPKFDELYGMISQLEEFFNEDPNPDDGEWSKNLNAIIDFQDDDGSFKLFDSDKIPSDAKVDFCHVPTYICTATIMKAFLKYSEIFTLKEKSSLSKGLKKSCAKNLRGHGFEALKGQIEALNIFIDAGVSDFIALFPDFCQEFTQMIEKITSKFADMEFKGQFYGPWGESYEEDIKAINEYFCQRLVFVYGTLMKGEANHHFLENSTFLGKAFIEGYEMYDVGWYPAIVAGDSIIVGELYRVPTKDLPSIDRLEGEGDLYIKKYEMVTYSDGKTACACIYVYNRDVSNLKRISSWNEEYVWYVSYGSNMLKERFMCYIEGGSYEGSRYHPPCDDTTPPVAVKAIDIPHDMYFANTSGSWDFGGVSFLDTNNEGKALGVAYLITKEQFDHVVFEENSGRPQNPDYGWYEDTIDLESIDGFEVKTITNKILLPYNEPVAKYLDVLRRGIRENWPDMSDEEIDDYLDYCTR